MVVPVNLKCFGNIADGDREVSHPAENVEMKAGLAAKHPLVVG